MAIFGIQLIFKKDGTSEKSFLSNLQDSNSDDNRDDTTSILKFYYLDNHHHNNKDKMTQATTSYNDEKIATRKKAKDVGPNEANAYVFLTDKKSGQIYLLPDCMSPEMLSEIEAREKSGDYTIKSMSKNEFVSNYVKTQKVSFNYGAKCLYDPLGFLGNLLRKQDKDTHLTIIFEAVWQSLCAMIVPFTMDGSKGIDDLQGNLANPFNIGSNLGYPIALGAIAAIIRYFILVYEYKKAHPNQEIPDDIQKAMILDCVYFGIKSGMSMLWWEAGYFVGASLITFAHIGPHSWMAYAALAICTGLFQGVGNVLDQMFYENYCLGNPQTDAVGYLKLFICVFIGGFVWQGIAASPFTNDLAGKVNNSWVMDGLLGIFTLISGTICGHILPRAPTAVHTAFSFFSSGSAPSHESPVASASPSTRASFIGDNSTSTKEKTPQETEQGTEQRTEEKTSPETEQGTETQDTPTSTSQTQHQ